MAVVAKDLLAAVVETNANVVGANVGLALAGLRAHRRAGRGADHGPAAAAGEHVAQHAADHGARDGAGRRVALGVLRDLADPLDLAGALLARRGGRPDPLGGGRRGARRQQQAHRRPSGHRCGSHDAHVPSQPPCQGRDPAGASTAAGAAICQPTNARRRDRFPSSRSETGTYGRT